MHISYNNLAKIFFFTTMENFPYLSCNYVLSDGLIILIYNDNLAINAESIYS